MTPRIRRVALVVIIVVAVAAVVWRFADRSDKTAPSKTVASVATSPAQPTATTRPEGLAAREFRETGLPALAQLTPRPLVDQAERSPLADSLHAPAQTGMQDLATVLNLFDHYREKFGALPVGESNAQIVNALTGNNPGHLALIDRAHPAINPAGELTDRWGTPLFFHLIARDALEIRSAGPDKKMWNEDDLLHQSPSLRQPPRDP